MFKKIVKFLFFSTYFFPTALARIPISDMFNFETKEYVPYIIVTLILLITLIPKQKLLLKFIRSMISLILIFFLALIFPLLFCYKTQGFSKFMIVLIAFYCSIITCIIIIWCIFKCIKNELMKTKFIVSGTLIILIAFIFPPLFIYVADGLSKLTIISTALYWRTIASILIAIITFLISKDELNKKIEIAIIILAIPLTLIMIISHQPLVFYATNNLDSVTITYLVLLDSLIFIVNFLELAKRHFTSYCSPKLFTWGGIMLVLISLSMVIYSVVIAIKFGWKYSYITAIVRDGHVI